MRQKPKKSSEWPQIWHGPGGETSEFKERMYVPLGWTPYPQLKPIVEKPKPKPLNKEELKAELMSKGVKIDPRWSAAAMAEVLNSIGE